MKRSFGDRAAELGAMKALQATCIVGAVTFTGMMIHQVGGNTPGATVPAEMPEAAVSETPGAPALSAAVEASAGPGTVLGAELGSVPGAGSGPSLMARAEIGGDSFEAKWMALGHHDSAQPMPTTHDAPDDTSNPAPVTQDFRYLIYYVSSELPPAEKPAAIVLRSLKATPVGTPVEEIKRASDAFGLDFNFMKAVAKVEFRFRPQATHRVVYRAVPTEQIRVRQIRLRRHSQSPRQCRCGGLQGHYRRHSVRVGDTQSTDLERSLLDPSTGLGRRRRAHQPPRSRRLEIDVCHQ